MELDKYQQSALEDIVKRDVHCITLPYGFGKTRVALSAISLNGLGNVIVIAPPYLKNEWCNAAMSFGYNTVGDEAYDVWQLTQMLQGEFPEKGRFFFLSKYADTKKLKAVISETGNIDACIIDEARYASYKTNIYKFAVQAADILRTSGVKIYTLARSLYSQRVTEAYAPLRIAYGRERCIAEGLGANPTDFISKFFKFEEASFGSNIVLDKRKASTLQSICHSLTARINNETYQQMIDEGIYPKTIVEDVTLLNYKALVERNYNAQRQLSSGFRYISDDGKRKKDGTVDMRQYVGQLTEMVQRADREYDIHAGSKKLQWLAELVSSIETPVLVWTVFTAEQELLYSFLRETFADRHVTTNEFDTTPKRISILNVKKSAGFNTQTDVTHVIYYTVPDSKEDYNQSLARVVRRCNKNTVHVYRITLY